MPKDPAATLFAVHTDTGDGRITTELFDTPEERLRTLRERAQAYFPGASVPSPLGSPDEAGYLAQLLGWFLMINDGSVKLSSVPGTPASVEA